MKIGQKVCDSCRKKIAKTTGDSSESDKDETVVFNPLIAVLFQQTLVSKKKEKKDGIRRNQTPDSQL